MKTRALLGGLGAAAVFAVALLVPAPARAVPAFARQTGLPCSSCHFQHFPSLNAYGRAFKSGNFAQAGAEEVVKGYLLSLPRISHLSIVSKIKYVKTNGGTGVGQDVGEFQFPDELAFFLGGRVGSNMGFVLEGQLADPDAPVMASFKLPIGFEAAGGTLSAIPFSTDGLGTAFAFELLNTGAVRNMRTLEERSVISAQQYVAAGSGEGAAQGVALAYARAQGFTTVALWAPHQGIVPLERPSYYARAALTPTLEGWELGLGAQAWLGTCKLETIEHGTKAWAIDAQAQGMVGTRPLGVYLAYARAPGTPAGAAPSDTNFFNTKPNAQSAFSAAAELGIWPSRATLGLAYRVGDTGALTNSSDNAAMVAATFLLAQNVELQASHTFYNGDAWRSNPADQKSSFMLFVAF